VALARLAGVLEPHMLRHEQRGRLVVELLARLLADLHQPGPARPTAAPRRAARRCRPGDATARGRALPASLATGPAPLDAIFFLSRRRDPSRPTLRPISGGEAAAHLYANALNPLAHSGEGLDGAIRIAKQTSSFELLAAELPAICAFVIGSSLRALTLSAPWSGLV
jgi:hypothetical protein